MAILLQGDEFDADRITGKVIGIASHMAMHDSGFHFHTTKAQLLYAPSGCMTVTTADKQFILPPFRMLWIPAHEIHRVNFRNVVDYRSIYFDQEYIEMYIHPEFKIMHVNALLKEIIERICFWEWNDLDENKENILKVFLNEINLSPVEKLQLKIPQDVRIKRIVEEWTLRISSPPMLKDLAQKVGGSEKTISRIFMKETSLSYQEWRQQWRIQRAVELLIEGNSIGETSHLLEFSSDSAFIEFFKKNTGTTPLKFLLNHQ